MRLLHRKAKRQNITEIPLNFSTSLTTTKYLFKNGVIQRNFIGFACIYKHLGK